MMRTVFLGGIFLVLGALAGWFLGMQVRGTEGIAIEEDLAGMLRGDRDVLARAGRFEVTRAELEYRWREVLDARTRGLHRSRGGVRDYLEQILEEKMMAQAAIDSGVLKDERTVFDLAMTRDLLLSKPLLEQEVRFRAFPETEMRQWYEEHIEEFERPETVHARHIVVTPHPWSEGQAIRNRTGDDATNEEETAEKIKFLQEKLSEGEDFSELARMYSEDLTVVVGGDLGLLRRGEVFPELEDAVFQLPPGEVSEPITTDLGTHLLLVEEKHPGGPVSFDEALPEIVDRLLQADPEATARRYRAWMEELRERYPIEVVADEETLQAVDNRR